MLDNLPISPIPLFIGGYVVYVLATWAYNLWFHPLRHIPGPWYCAISPLYITIKDFQFVKAYVLHDLLEKYGGIVRVEPNQVIYVDTATTRLAYTKFPKSSWYKALLTNNNDHAMTTLETMPHSVRKRAYGPHYIPANLALYQPEVQEFTNHLFEKMNTYRGKKPFDCLVLFRRLLTDIIFISSYGQRIDSVKQWDIVNFSKDPAEPVVTAVNLFPIRGVLRSYLPAPVFNLFCNLPFAATKPLFDSDKTIAKFVIKARDVVLERDSTFKLTGDIDMDGLGDERLSLVHRLLRQSFKAKPEDRLSELDVISEAMGHTIAGVETTSTTLTYMCYNLARWPKFLAKIREEIDPLMQGAEGRNQVPDISVVNRLPFVNAFYMESMRIYGAVPSMLERVVPKSLDGDLVIKGYKIPAGSHIATQAFSAHRDPKAFPDPEEFKPERWLQETEEMRAAWMPFGTGNRICGGMNLAHMTLRLVLIAIARNYDIVIPPETTADSMEQRYAFVLMPKAQKAYLTFKYRAD